MPSTANNCKVITTCFVGREIRPDTKLEGIPEGWFDHAQTFPDPEAVLELIELIVEIERKLDPGAESDTIIVNNDVGWERGRRLLDSIDGSKTLAGRLRVLHRPNYGRSYGGYNAAFERYGDQYDYWTFTEDDILVNGPNYLRACIDRFERDANDSALSRSRCLSPRPPCYTPMAEWGPRMRGCCNRSATDGAPSRIAPNIESQGHDDRHASGAN